MPLFTKVVERFNVIPIKIAMVFFTEREKKILKFIENRRKPCMAKVQ